MSDGPNIPDSLLWQRDQGRVVFLCGAGVSMSVGMPSFLELTRRVLDYFDPPEKTIDEIWGANIEPSRPLDQVFHWLYQEFGRKEVSAQVAEILKANSDTEYKAYNYHKVIARISSDMEGRPQVVTTNFDHLFESTLANTARRYYEPPDLPDLSLGTPLKGIIYLHGRLPNSTEEEHSYVLSSADFGRAYLAEGWATKFVQSLLRSYTVVMVGYQAEDPPMRYLLEGLNLDERSDRSHLYAFDIGKPEEVESKWRDRGVTAIAYEDHPLLWSSLKTWAERADNPRKWKSGIVVTAQQGPSKLQSHERGQVAHLLRTTSGARLFAEADPSPSAEWLAVLDANCRSGKPWKSSHMGDDEEFDPLDTYGLDGDPCREKNADLPNRDLPNREFDNILALRPGELPRHHYSDNSIGSSPRIESIPPRLEYLYAWIIKHLDSPVTAWWALRQNSLHPFLTKNLERALLYNQLQPEAALTWELILEYQKNGKRPDFILGPLKLKRRIEKYGWVSSTLRHFQADMAPTLAYELPISKMAAQPPQESWEDIALEDIGRWSVKFQKINKEELEVPDEIIARIFRIAEGHLHIAEEFFQNLKPRYSTPFTCYPAELGHQGEGQETINWFIKLFRQLTEVDPERARGHALTWSSEDRYYFRKLKLFAYKVSTLFTGDEAAQLTLNISLEGFWDKDTKWEVLFLIRDRWKEMSEVNQLGIIDRLLRGQDHPDTCTEEENAKRSCSYLKWLKLNGIPIPTQLQEEVSQLAYRFPEISDEYVRSLSTPQHSEFRTIVSDYSYDALINLPLEEIVECSQQGTQRVFGELKERRPFSGLVKHAPRKALAAVSLHARRKEYSSVLWTELISHWPDNVTPRLLRVFVHRLIRLPHNSILQVSYALADWIRIRLVDVFYLDANLTWTLVDRLIDSIEADPDNLARSALSDAKIEGHAQRSRRTLNHALNGSVGKTTSGLLKVLESMNLKPGEGIPGNLRNRLDRLTSLEGEGGDHAVSILFKHIVPLYNFDPDWSKNSILPWLDLKSKNSEPAWSGLIYAEDDMPQEVLLKIKENLSELLPKMDKWGWPDEENRAITRHMIFLAIFKKGFNIGLSERETRRCLQAMSEKQREHTVNFLGQIGREEENGWFGHVIPFIETVWPKELKFRTTNLTTSWLLILSFSGSMFPEVLKTVQRFLVPLETGPNWLYWFSNASHEEGCLADLYPGDMLTLLDTLISENTTELVFYEVRDILTSIREANPDLVNDKRYLRLINLAEST